MIRLSVNPMILAAAILAACHGSARADDLTDLEQKAFREAVAKVARSVVQIETIGGLERAESSLLGTGPTTGLVVEADGYIVSSAFNFLSRPASILVRLPDGTRKAAKLVATDHHRMIVLLKIEPAGPLPVPEIAAEKDLRVGQWTIAVGRVFDAESPNLSVGILSAVGRLWGKAVQTDAAVSPNNYGGPLIDLHGRVIGVLAPLSPQSEAELAGVEWYDSGIGFAVVADRLPVILPRLKKGAELYRGLLGIVLRGGELPEPTAVIQSVHPRSPAEKAGLKPGDRITAMDGRDVATALDFRKNLTEHYAGDSVRVRVDRKGEKIERTLELVSELPPFEPPWLGILPTRPEAGKPSELGVVVRHVFASGPAARAKILAGDRITAIGGQKTPDRDSLVRELYRTSLDSARKLELARDGQTVAVEVQPDKFPQTLSADHVPPIKLVKKPEQPVGVKTGVFSWRVQELPNTIWACVPDSAANAPSGLFVWLAGAGKEDAEKWAKRWEPLCERYGFIAIVPSPNDLIRWQSQEWRTLGRIVQQAGEEYDLDAARIAIGGQESGGAAAVEAALRLRKVIRGCAVWNVSLPDKVPTNAPETPVQFLVCRGEKHPLAATIDAGVARLRKSGFPVVLGKTPLRTIAPTESELEDLARWLDLLDQF